MKLELISKSAPEENIALVDAKTGECFTYLQLRRAVAEWVVRLAAPRSLIFHFSRNSFASVAALFGALEAGHAVALINPQLVDGARARLIETYLPELLIDLPVGSVAGYQKNAETEVWVRSAGAAGEIHPDLAVLLSTSGSTGSPKFVRLTGAAVLHNARAIAQVLDITPADVGYGHLPIHYSYGLSVLASHLVSGASVVLTDNGPMATGYWSDIGKYGVSHLPGVPFHYQMMLKLGLARLKLPFIKTMTQAGGRLSPELQVLVHAHQESQGGRFHVMYGQTEASPRMTTMPHENLLQKLGSVGPALPDGRIDIVKADGETAESGENGEVVYCGPNVMMGYAQTRPDLALGDVNRGRLATGDLGYCDAEGYLFITGRSARITKIAGVRVSLDELEQALNGQAALVGVGEKLVVFRPALTGLSERDVLDMFERDFGILPHNCRFIEVEALPVKDSGKLDYAVMETMAQ
jgi:acyl-coenzyme A synthetase/AMP-(fatty) acid ligase